MWFAGQHIGEAPPSAGRLASEATAVALVWILCLSVIAVQRASLGTAGRVVAGQTVRQSRDGWPRPSGERRDVRPLSGAGTVALGTDAQAEHRAGVRPARPGRAGFRLRRAAAQARRGRWSRHSARRTWRPDRTRQRPKAGLPVLAAGLGCQGPAARLRRPG